jgi:drug/metabolite transporter (DMT)-like permease
MAAPNTVLSAPIAAGIPQKWLILMALATVYVVWGTTYLAIHIAIQSVPPFLLIGARFTIAGGVFYGVLRLAGAPNPTEAQWRNALKVGILLIGGGMAISSFAQQYITSGLASMLASTIPMWTALLGLFFGHKLGRNEIIGVLVGFLGVVLLSLDGTGGENKVIGVILMLVGAVCWCTGSLLTSKLDMPAGAMGNAASMLVGGVVVLIFSLLKGDRLTAMPPLEAWLAFFYLIIFGSIFAMTAYNYLLRTVRPALASSYAYVNPVLAIFLGATLAAEELPTLTVVALPLILLGVASIAIGKMKKAKA